MVGPTYALRHMFGTTRGIRLFLANLLVAFGAISAVVQFFGQLYPAALPDPSLVTAAAAGVCVLWATVRAWPRACVRHEFKFPDMTVVVQVGDLFDQQTHIVVGFTDTFDTSVAENRLVNSSSVQGQLLTRLYDDDCQRLDKDLSSALRDVMPVSKEAREHKHQGKLNRYAVGTVAVLRSRPQLVFGVAYSHMGNDCVAKSSVEDLWFSLNRLWDAVYRYGQREYVAIPLVGSGLARLDFLDRESILRMILLSFVARSREVQICRELRIVIWPPDLEKVDMLEIAAFLRTIGSQAAVS